MKGQILSKKLQNTINRREALRQGFAGAAGLASTSLFATEAKSKTASKRPNVIIFHTDDQDFNTIGCYGANALTPHIDSLANTGIRFDRGYTTTGVCTASRYALITGQYPGRCRTGSFLKTFPKNVPTEVHFNTAIVDGQHNIASVMQKAGYATGFVGKAGALGGVDGSRMKKYNTTGAWNYSENDIDPKDPEITAILSHNHDVKREGIKTRGFDYAEAITTNPENFRSRNLNYHNPEWITDRALTFIEDSSDKPFFLYMNHTLHHIPHPQESLLYGDPLMTHEGYLDEVPDCMPSRQEIYDRVVSEGYPPETAYMTWLDESLGALLKKLGELKLTDDTMIIFFSDNNVPAKGTNYEDGARVPCIIKYPACVAGAQESSRLVINIDFAPTIFDACGITPPDDMHIDGKNLMPMLTGEKEKIHDEVFLEIGWTRCVVTERWKYLALRWPESAMELKERKKALPGFKFIYHSRALEPHQHNALLWHPAFFSQDQLYDMSNDPHETSNLSEMPKHAVVLNDMKDRMKNWLNTFDNPFGEFTD